MLRFVESTTGRILLADEVGLGKTVEAMYIWKELQARVSARRLLVVCPAMLREKWRRDMQNLFNIHAEIDTAESLLRKVRTAATRNPFYSFASVAGLESVRPPKGFEDSEKRGHRAELAHFLDENPTTDEFGLFDLVIIDEAHNLRNSGTASNKLGRLLRDSSRHVVLLTATPIQVSSDNLLELLRLIDEDQFQDRFNFSDLLDANAPIVRLVRSIWNVPPDMEAIREDVARARSKRLFRENQRLARIEERIENESVSPMPWGSSPASHALSPEDQVELARMAESCSLLDQYVTRTRKREVLANRVIRSPQALSVRFSEPERRIYEHVSSQIRYALRDLQGSPSGWQFSLIMRQRQMASSLPAALQAWQKSPELEEMLWEDLGSGLFTLDELEGGDGLDSLAQADADGLMSIGGSGAPDHDVAELERHDQKYRALLQFLRTPGAVTGAAGEGGQDKTIVFAFFRNTLEYLHRRLTADGVRSALLMGGMPDAQEVLDRFARPDGPAVLLSSEVGSEGLDLQFCRRIVNYDLPWNPMRVEQRIGRLDRLGQTADRISIVNLVVENTIEDRILYRLYERIDLFKESIGDLEAILGERTDRLLFDLVNPCLSEAERLSKADQAALAIQNRKAEQERLEREAANLYGLSDYVTHRIQETRDQHRWLGPDDLWNYVMDFFDLEYPGTVIDPVHAVPGRSAASPGGPHASDQEAPADPSTPAEAMVRLSDDARYSLGDFIQQASLPCRTFLHETRRPLHVYFDPRRTPRGASGAEVVDLSHPLIRWIQQSHNARPRPIHPVSATSLAANASDVPCGNYVFVVHRWRFSGLRQEQVLKYRACDVDSGRMLTATESERLVEAASRFGNPIPNAGNVLSDPGLLRERAEACEDELSVRYGERLEDFQAENSARCDQFEAGVRAFAERRIRNLEQRIEGLRRDGKLRPIRAFEGQIEKAKDDRDTRLRKVEQKRVTDDEITQLVAGVICVGVV